MNAMIKTYINFLFLTLILLACSTKVNNLETDDGTFDEGNRLLEEEFYEEARKQFYRIKAEFPNSPLQAQADLKIADSYFQEESYKTAASNYEDFVRMYPGHAQVPYALYRAGLSYVNEMPKDPLRDTRATEKVIDTFTRLIVDYPDSEYAIEADKYVQDAQNQLAEKSFQIARFYERQGNHLAAARRFGRVVELFSDQTLAEEALARQIKNLIEAGDAEQAQQLLRRFQDLYPNSKFRQMIEL